MIAGTVIAAHEILISPWDALYVLPVAFSATALGANTAYHMYFTHRTFKTNIYIRTSLALLGTILCQDSIVQWVANHKRHHRHVDIADKDPHTPRQFGNNRILVMTIGLWWASMGWKFDRILTSKKFYAGQMLDEPMLKWFDKHFVAVSYSGFVIPFLIGWVIGGMPLGLKWFSYFGALRVFIGYFFTEFVVNGLCHALGSTKFDTKGNSTNLVFLSTLTLGATLHHNHHAFPRVMSPAVDKEFDPMKLLYRILQKYGVIQMVSGPTTIEIEQKRLPGKVQLVTPDVDRNYDQ